MHTLPRVVAIGLARFLGELVVYYRSDGGHTHWRYLPRRFGAVLTPDSAGFRMREREGERERERERER